MSEIVWQLLDEIGQVSPAAGLAAATAAAGRSRRSGQYFHAVIRQHPAGWVLSVSLDGYHAFSSNFLIQLQDVADQLISDAGPELEQIRSEEKARGNSGAPFKLSNALFRIIVPHRLLERSKLMIEQCFVNPSSVIIERE